MSESREEQHAPWRVATFALVLGVVLMLLARGLSWSLNTENSPAWAADQALNGRLHRLLTAMPTLVATSGPINAVIGSSRLTLGFDPIAFDGELKRLGEEGLTFNLSVPAATPDVQAMLVRKLAQLLERHGRRLGIAVIPFPHDMATLRTQKGYRRRATDSIGEMADVPELLSLAATDVDRAAEIVSHRVVFGGPRPEDLRMGLFRVLGLVTFPDTIEGHAARYGLRVFNEWDEPRRGAYPLPPYPELYGRVAGMMQAKRAELVASAVERHDIRELHFDARQLDEFVVAVKRLKSCADKILVVLAPQRLDWIRRSSGGERRLRAALQEIGRKTGLQVVDHSRWARDSYFLDHTHLRPDIAAESYSLALAQAAMD